MSSEDRDLQEIVRRRKHVEAQRRYRKSKLDETRAEARKRMARLRMNRTEEEVQAANKKRREDDADYRELVRRRTFRNTYGDNAFFDLYFPQYQLQGKHHLPGLRFDKNELKKRCEEQEKREKREQRRHAKAAVKAKAAAAKGGVGSK